MTIYGYRDRNIPHTCNISKPNKSGFLGSRYRCVNCSVLIENNETHVWCSVIGLGKNWKQGVGRVFHHDCYISELEEELQKVKNLR